MRSEFLFKLFDGVGPVNRLNKRERKQKGRPINAGPSDKEALDFPFSKVYILFIAIARYKYLEERAMPKLVDHVQYRKHLLEQCFDLFSIRGYSALTTRQIAEALNVSSGTL